MLDTFKFLHDPYFDYKVSFHWPFSEESILHFYFASKTLLNRSMCLIPNPPSCLGLQILSQLIQTTFLPSAPQSYRNFCCNFVIILHILTGALKKERKYRWMTFKIDLIRQMCPVNDRFLPFHTDNVFLILDNTSSQKVVWVGLPPTGKPKYLKGVTIMLHRRTS